MLQKNQAQLKLGNIITDLVIVLISSYFAWQLRFDVLDGINNVEISSVLLLFLAVLFSGVCVSVLYMFNIYAPQRMKKTGSNTLRIFVSNGLCTLLLMAFLFLTKAVDVPRLMLAISWAISSILISLKHIALHHLLHVLREKGYNLRHYIVVGDGHLARQYIQNVQNNPFMGIVVSGYISGVDKEGLGQRLGSYEEIGEVLARNKYDGVVIALEPHEVRFMQDILEAADREGARVELIPFFNDYYPSFPTFDTIGSSKLIDLRATPLDQAGNAFMKRTADILGSLLVLILLSPVFLITAIGVKLSSAGPVIFKQKRIGRNKKPFTMYKFRSMRVTDTEDTGWTTDQDARKTKFGSLIRKFSIDELPQFWNVLKGDMSIIGPRPEIPFHVDHFKQEIPRYLVRQQVRPGITGWAQVNGFRGDTSIEERIRYDIEYIENWTIGLDIRIAFKTIFGGMINKEVSSSTKRS